MVDLRLLFQVVKQLSLMQAYFDVIEEIDAIIDKSVSYSRIKVFVLDANGLIFCRELRCSQRLMAL